MNFKEYFYLKENPDTLYMESDKKDRTFLIHGEFIAFFETLNIPTHSYLLDCLRYKYFLKPKGRSDDELEDQLGHVTHMSLSNIRSINNDVITIGHPDDDLLKYISSYTTVFNRENCIHSVKNCLLGRIVINDPNKKIISFWNTKNSFNNTNKSSTFEMIQRMGGNPKEYIYEIGNSDDGYNSKQLSYDQFKNLNGNGQEEKIDTSHIVHMMSPDKKKDALLAQGAKPKIPLGAEQRFAMGENINFKQFFYLKENPDDLYGENIMSRTFLYDKSFFAYAESDWEVTHYVLLMIMKKRFNIPLNKNQEIDFQQNKKLWQRYDKDVKMEGDPTPEFLGYLKNAPNLKRDTFFNMVPSGIMGRIAYDDNKTISFWNTKEDFNKRNIINAIKVIKDIYGDEPKKYKFEIMNYANEQYNQESFFLNFQEFLGLQENKPVDKKQEKQKTDNIIHMLPPEKKREALLAQGAKPKIPLPIEQKFKQHIGDDFKQFFNSKQLLTEMPLRVDSLHFDPINTRKWKNYGQYQKDGEFKIANKTVEVYSYINTHRGGAKSFDIINNEDVIGRYAGIEKGDGIQTQNAQTHKFVQGYSIMFEFYKNFLLKKYSFVESDDILSDAGFGFFYKNFDKFKELGYKIFGLENGKEIGEAQDKEDLHKYWDYVHVNPRVGNIRFKIRK